MLSEINTLRALTIVSNHKSTEFLNKKISEEVINKKVEADMSELCNHLGTIRDLVLARSPLWISKSELLEYHTPYIESAINHKMRNYYQEIYNNALKEWNQSKNEIENNKTFLSNVKLNKYNIGFINGFIMANRLNKRLTDIYTTKIIKPGDDLSDLSGIDGFETEKQREEELQNNKNYILKAEYHDIYPFQDTIVGLREPGWYFNNDANYPSHDYSYQR